MSETEKLLDYINQTPELLSLLYDLGWMPEQLRHGSSEWCKMMFLAERWRRLMDKERITWHDLEAGNPEKQTFVIVVTNYQGYSNWYQGYYMGGKWWNATDHRCLMNVVKWGSFDLPELPEVKT